MKLIITDEMLADPDIRGWIKEVVLDKGVRVDISDFTNASEVVISKLLMTSADLRWITLWSPELIWADISTIRIPNNGDWPNPLINRGTAEEPDWQRKRIWEYFHIIRSSDTLRCIIKLNVDMRNVTYENNSLKTGNFVDHATADQLTKMIAFFGGWKTNAWKNQWIAENVNSVE